MTHEEFITLYWKQYISIEKNFLDTEEYVAINKKNYATFSLAYSKLFLTICSEIDSLSVEFSQMIKEDYQEESDIKANNILKRFDTIAIAYEDINSYTIRTNDNFAEMYFVPFSKRDRENMADWWHDYNDYKHRRTGKTDAGRYNFEKANLKNVLYSLSALYLLCCLVNGYFEDDNAFECKSDLFVSEY